MVLMSSEVEAPPGLMDYGDPRLPDRFWAKVYPEPNTGCWLWSGATTGNGYGIIIGAVPQVKVVAHRWAKAACSGGWPARSHTPPAVTVTSWTSGTFTSHGQGIGSANQLPAVHA